MDGRKASLVLRALALVIPAAAGFVLAFIVLQLRSPFDTGTERLSWILIAVVVAIGASTLVARWLERLLPTTTLYEQATRFEEELDVRFRATLRRTSKQGLNHASDEEFERFVAHSSALLSALTKHERLTRGHSERVRAYSALIGEQLDLDDDAQELLTWSALLHDVGKLDVEAGILTKTGKPDAREWEVLRRHPAAASRKLRDLHEFLGPQVEHGARYHHERWDGKGYPDGLAGTDIPPIGRIVAVADAFDVMTHARSYKKPFPIEHARQELLANRGTQFDPAVVDAFLKIGTEELSEIRGWSASLAGATIAAGSSLLTTTTQAAVVVASVGGGVAASQIPEVALSPPAVVAFEEVATSTTPPTTTTAAPIETTTTETTTTTTAAPTTSAAPATIAAVSDRVVSYEIGDVVDNGVVVQLNPDRLELSSSAGVIRTVEISPGQRRVDVTIPGSAISAGQNLMTFTLWRGDDIISTDQIVVRG